MKFAVSLWSRWWWFLRCVSGWWVMTLFLIIIKAGMETHAQEGGDCVFIQGEQEKDEYILLWNPLSSCYKNCAGLPFPCSPWIYYELRKYTIPLWVQESGACGTKVWIVQLLLILEGFISSSALALNHNSDFRRRHTGGATEETFSMFKDRRSVELRGRSPLLKEKKNEQH